MGHVYIQTNKFYTVPKYEAYNRAKKTHIESMDIDYDSKQTGEKWTFLMAQLASSLGQEHMPNGEQIIQFQTRLAAFKTKREGTSNSYFNLSLTQCVHYFEEFHFLYNTTDPHYKLTDAAKKDLLKSISEAIDVCETGLNGRLYTALQAHQKESDWIQNELVKARCETLRMLHHQFGGQDVHVYNKLVQLANQAHLGIPKKEEILDIHAGMVDSDRLEAFFNQHYPALFERYEQQTEDSLTNHYLSELATTLGINSAEWAAGRVTIPVEKTGDITHSITAYFQGIPTEGIHYALGDLSEDDMQYTLKSKQDVAKTIKGLVAQKLMAEQYVVTLDQIAVDRTIHPHLRLKKGVVLDELITLNQALKQNDPQQIQDKLQQNPLILMHYPDLIISQIQSNSAILSSVPRWLKTDTRFIDSSMVALNQLLCDAISENNENAIRDLTFHVLNLIQSEYGYLQQLSEPVLKNPIVGAMLVEKNGLLFGYLHSSLQDDSSLQAQVERQDLLGVYKEPGIKKGVEITSEAYENARKSLPNEYQNEPGLGSPNPTLPYHQSRANFLRIKAFIALLTPSALTNREFFEHVNDLNPSLLLKVIEYRKRNALPPLAFFDHDKTYQELKQFDQEITSRLAPDWSQDYLSIKRKACEQENFGFIRNPFAKKNAVTYLSKTDTWFAGFNQYHVYQSSHERLWERLAIMPSALYRLFFSVAKICFWAAVLEHVIPVLTPIIAMYFWQGFLTCIGLSLLNFFLKSPFLSTVNQVIWRVIWLDFDLWLSAINTIFIQCYHAIIALLDIVDCTFALLGLISNAFSPLFSQNEYIAGTLEDRCENTVLRLDGMNEASAQSKGELLRELLTQVKAEANREPNRSFRELLDTPYPITYQGQMHAVSFSEVASKRRAHYGEFKLGDQPDRMRFFSGRTTTEALLATVEPVPRP